MSITINRDDGVVDGSVTAAGYRVGLDHGRLKDSVALVTGAGRGIGQLVALSFAQAGAAVAVVARSAVELAHTVDLISTAGGDAAAAVADVTDTVGFAAAVADLRRQLGPFDLLVNNAGILGPAGPLWNSSSTSGGRRWTSTYAVSCWAHSLSCPT